MKWVLRIEQEFIQKEKVDLYIHSARRMGPRKARLLETGPEMTINRRVHMVNI